MQASPTQCHSWQGREQWVAYKEFADALHRIPLDVLLNCDSWQVQLVSEEPHATGLHLNCQLEFEPYEIASK
jgi:hypothetical protein